MKWTKAEMARWPQGRKDFEEEISFDPATFEKNGRLRNLENIVIRGTADYDYEEERLIVRYQVSGRMILPCSITLEDVVRDFTAEDVETFSFRKVTDDADVTEVKGDTIDLMPSVFATIMAEVPWIVHKEGLEELPKGNGWEVLTEEQLHQGDKGIDPRLAKLLQYKPEED